MGWKENVEIARAWTKSENSQFELKQITENERKLLFASFSGELSFSVTIPESSNKLEIWSDDGRVAPFLSDLMEFTEKRSQADLMEVLQKIGRDLTSVLGAAAKDDDSDDEDEDDAGYSDEDMDDGYYNQDDEDAMNDTETKPPEEPSEADKQFSGVSNNPVATQRLLKDLKALDKSKGEFHVQGVPRGDNIFIWDVKLTNFDPKSTLGRDMAEFAKKQKCEPAVYMEMKFPRDYPMSPPFARVLRPRFQFLTGHVTIGGSVCMEVLTKSGWMPTNDIESILVQIRAEIMSDPKARLDLQNIRPYDEREARDAFERMVKRYGWQ